MVATCSKAARPSLTKPPSWAGGLASARRSAIGCGRAGGRRAGGLADRSRRPQHSPARSSTAMEGVVLAGGALDR